MHRFIIAALANLLLPAAATAMDAPRRTAPTLQNGEVRFGVYTLGGRAFDVDMRLVREADGLRVVSGARTTGPANLLLRFRMESDLRIRLKPEGGITPLRFASHSDGTFSRRTIVMVWGPDGLPNATVEPPAEADDRDPVLPEQTRNTFDPTTALLARALLHEGAEPCAGSDQVYDGRRRYNLHYRAVGTEMLPEYRRSAYAGPALKCELRFEPIAGYSHKYMQNTRKLENEVTDMWLARLPGEPVWLPVRLRSNWMMGELGGHILAARINGREVIKPLELAPAPAPAEIPP